MHLSNDSGLTVLEFIRSEPSLHNIKVFVISSDDVLRKACESLGIDGWMTKPIHVSSLIEQVEYLLPNTWHN
jgi:CheY-like chemotaxis protein